jgi:hypothetical protein
MLFIAHGCFAQEYRDRELCNVRLPLESPVSSVAIVKNTATLITGRQSTYGRITLRNEGDLPITEYALLLEVFTASHERLYDLIFHDSVSEKMSAPAWMLPAYKLKSSINALDTFQAFAETSLISNRCPAAIAITFAYFRFANGKVAQNAAAHWTADPTVGIQTDHLSFDGCSIPKNAAGIATLQLDSQARIRSLVLEGPALSPKLTRCLREELDRWEFVSAEIDGHPANSTIKFAVLFNLDNARWMHWEDEYSNDLRSGLFLLDLRAALVEGKEYWTAGFCCSAATKSRDIQQPVLGHVSLLGDRDSQN